jgi:hypothetical protein
MIEQIKRNVVPEDNEYLIRQVSYRSIFSTPDGQAILKDLLQFCRWEDLTITDSSALNAHLMGLKSVIQHIEEMCESELVETRQEEE